MMRDKIDWENVVVWLIALIGCFGFWILVAWWLQPWNWLK